MIEKVGLGTAILLWNMDRAFKLAREHNLGVEILPLRWHTLKYVKKLKNKYPEVKVLTVHSSFYRDFKTFKRNLKHTKKEGMSRTFLNDWLWLACIGTVMSNPGRSIADEYNCPLVVHPQVYYPGIYKNSAIENPARHEPCRLSLSEIRKYFSDQKRVLDVSHIAHNRLDLLKAYEIMNPDIIHFSDSRIGCHDHFPPGYGEMPLGDLLKIAQASKKKITLIIELFPFRASNIEDNIATTVKFLEDHGVKW